MNRGLNIMIDAVELDWEGSCGWPDVNGKGDISKAYHDVQVTTHSLL